jgi:hypothetical protein
MLIIRQFITFRILSKQSAATHRRWRGVEAEFAEESMAWERII